MTTKAKEPQKASSNGAKPVTRQVCLLGYAEETRDKVHSLPKEVEIWGINMAHHFLKRDAHYWFQLHPKDWSAFGGEPTGYYGRPKAHLEWMQQFDGTVWMLDEDNEIPNSKRYPLEKIIARFGRKYLTSSFAYMLALALLEHLEGSTISTLYMYGINLTAYEEYGHQRPCAEYWLGRLEEAGVQVYIPAASALLKGPEYPAKGDDLSKHAMERLQHWKDNYIAAWSNCTTSLAMMYEVQHWKDFLNHIADAYGACWTDEMKTEIQEHLQARYSQFQRMSQQYESETHGALGVVKDCNHFLTLLGGADFKAPKLPDLRAPNPELAGDFNFPSSVHSI